MATGAEIGARIQAEIDDATYEVGLRYPDAASRSAAVESGEFEKAVAALLKEKRAAASTDGPPTLWFSRMPFNHPDHRDTKPKVHIFARRGTTSMSLLVALCGYEVLEYESSNPSQPLRKTEPPVADRCALCVAKHNGTSSGPKVRTPKRPAHKPRSTAVDASIAKRRAKEPSQPRIGEFMQVTAGMLFDVLEQVIDTHGADAPIHVVGRTPEHHPLEGDPATPGYAMSIAQISDTAKGSLVIRVDTRPLQPPEGEGCTPPVAH